MKKRKVVLISLDEVRADNLSCYGYKKIQTPNIDKIAKEGVLFEKCIGPGCMTPICMSSVICAQYPNKHTMRLPLCRIQSRTVAEILKEYGYTTVGFTGNGLIGSRHGFNAGFDSFYEPPEDTSWDTWSPTGKDEDLFYEGWWWVDNMLQWIRENHQSTFFIWGHLYETHEGAEVALLRDGRIKEGVLSELRYKDARLKCADEGLIGGLIKVFDEFDLWDNTTLIIMSDHGTSIGEHPVKPIPHRSGGLKYPQHRSLYDHDITVPLIMKDKDLPVNRRVKGMVRSVDIIPTLLAHLGIPTEKFDFDGISLLPIIKKGKAEGLVAYAEDLYEYGSDYDKEPNLDVGSLQTIRTDKVKLIRNLTKGTEEFYNLEDDPSEKNNLIEELRESEEVVGLRRQLNSFLLETKGMSISFSSKERKEVEDRLRSLGYIE